MPRKKLVPTEQPIPKPKLRTPRRSDEELEQLLLRKLQKVQERIVKKHHNTYYHIGYLFSITTGLKIADLTEEDISEILQKTEDGEAVIKKYAFKIKMRKQTKEQLDSSGNGCAYDYEI